jgi:hypothetical protein
MRKEAGGGFPLPLVYVFMNRIFHGYGVGVGHTGTRSLTAMFRHYAAAHERGMQRIAWLLQQNPNQLPAYIERLERRHPLDLNVSFTHVHYIELLVCKFPRAQYVVLGRPAIDWLASYAAVCTMNFDWRKAIRRGHQSVIDWRGLARLRFMPENYAYTQYDSVLADYAMFPAEAYFASRQRIYQRLFTAIPKCARICIHTNDLFRRAPDIARFFNIPPDSLDATAHRGRRPLAALPLTDLVEPAYLAELAARYPVPEFDDTPTTPGAPAAGI